MKKNSMIAYYARRARKSVAFRFGKLMKHGRPKAKELQQDMTENIGIDFLRKEQPRALLCYISFDAVGKIIRTGITHCNQPEFYLMIRYFIDEGYSLDICSFNFDGEFKKDYYDVILGFGKAFFKARECNKNAKDIFLMTENPYYISMKREQERLDYFKERHGFIPKYYRYRSGRCFQEDDEKKCSRILAMGDESYLKRDDVILKRLIPTGFFDDGYVPDICNRDKKSFLCLASDGFIHKGYDLLLELFQRHPEWTLYFCGGVLKEHAEELNIMISDNILDCGFVSIPSQRFRQICDKCASSVLFSCSEGMSTSLLTSMRMGLVPITCSGNGMEICGEGIIFSEGYHLDEIERAMEKITDMDDMAYTNYSEKIFEYANQTFTLNEYAKRFSKYVEELLEFSKP